MSRIYLVSDGSYSDYYIVAAFSARELAEAFVKEQDEHSLASFDKPGKSDYRVEEMEIDGAPKSVWAGCWYAVLYDNGGGYTAWRDGGNPHTPASMDDPTSRGYGRRAFTGYGETREHARRSAEELRRVTLTEPPNLANQEARAEMMKILGPRGFYIRSDGQ